MRSVFRLGGTWTFVSLASYVSYNVEKMLLGRYWGAESLGLYGRAYQLVSLPTELLNSVGSVVMSALSRLQHEPERLRRAFTVSYSLVISVTVPVTLTCLLAAEEIVGVVLGPKWREAAGILRALAPTTLALSLMFPFAWFLQATARNRVSIGTTLLVPPLLIGGILFGLRHGPVGVAVGYSVGASLAAVPVIAWCRSVSEIPMAELWDAIWRPVLAGLLASAGGAAVKFTLGDVPPLLALVAEMFVFFPIYAWTLLVVLNRGQSYRELFRSVISRSGVDSTAVLADVPRV